MILTDKRSDLGLDKPSTRYWVLLPRAIQACLVGKDPLKYLRARAELERQNPLALIEDQVMFAQKAFHAENFLRSWKEAIMLGCDNLTKDKK